MINQGKNKSIRRLRRKHSVRARIQRRSDRPRLSVFRSLKHISAQIIDDRTGRTLCAATSTAKTLSGDLQGKKKSERAAVVGAELARRAKEMGIEEVVLDRGFSRFHGRVKALADAARAAGLKF